MKDINLLVNKLQDSKSKITDFLYLNKETKMRDIMFKMSSIERQISKFIEDIEEESNE